jgi:hypothetical protein
VKVEVVFALTLRHKVGEVFIAGTGDGGTIFTINGIRREMGGFR